MARWDCCQILFCKNDLSNKWMIFCPFPTFIHQFFFASMFWFIFYSGIMVDRTYWRGLLPLFRNVFVCECESAKISRFDTKMWHSFLSAIYESKIAPICVLFFGINSWKSERTHKRWEKGIAPHPKLDDGFTCGARENVARENCGLWGTQKKTHIRVFMFLTGDSEEKMRLSQRGLEAKSWGKRNTESNGNGRCRWNVRKENGGKPHNCRSEKGKLVEKKWVEWTERIWVWERCENKCGQQKWMGGKWTKWRKNGQKFGLENECWRADYWRWWCIFWQNFGVVFKKAVWDSILLAINLQDN